MNRTQILEAVRDGRLGVDDARRALRVGAGSPPPPAVAVPVEPGAPAPVPAPAADDRARRDELEAVLARTLAAALYTDEAGVARDRNFKDLGLDSIVSVEWINALKKQYGVRIPATKVYDHPTIQQFAVYLDGLIRGPAPARAAAPAPRLEIVELPRRAAPAPAAAVPAPERPGGRIAIVGMAGRYPGAAHLRQFWENLAAGRNSIREIPRERWDVNAFYDADPSKPGKIYCKWLGALDAIDRFDAPFFMISPAEAEGMDPQYRIFMEQAYHAFEDAGYSPPALSQARCGVYMGVMNSEYVHLLPPQQAQALNTGNSPSIAAARISYFLNLKGPAIPIDTACSSSLVATHLACQALRNGEIDLALVGGVTLYLTPASFIGMCAAGMLSADGQCRSFDNGANGFVPGEGAGALVLKRLEDAERDHDCIHGVILGSGINQDGRTNGITAPSVTSQIELERDVYRRFGIDPATIDYVEAHGTGTKLGDPVELEALTTVFRERTSRRGFCGLGSVKSNIGHTSAAAGMAGIQKMLLCFQHRTLVPTLHFREANTHCDFEDSPFYVNTETKPWRARPDTPRRAAVSSMGFSGTNAHVVIEEYPVRRPAPAGGDGAQPIVLSAKNESRLRELARNLHDFLQAPQDLPALRDIAYTLQVGRDPMEERLGLVAASTADLVAKLEAFLAGRSGAGVHRGRVPRVRGKLALREPDAAMAGTVAAWIEGRDFGPLLEQWVTGLVVDWARWHGNERPYRVSLPGYPFARERYWVASAPASVEVRDLGRGVRELRLGGAAPAAVLAGAVRALREVAAEADAKVVLLSGDESSFLGGDAADSAADERKLADELIAAIAAGELPVIAVVKGGAVGAGAMIAGACDFLVCAEEAGWRFPAPEERDGAGRPRGLLAARFGRFASGAAPFTGRDCRELGFPVVPAAEVDGCALRLAQDIAGAPRRALGVLKQHFVASAGGLPQPDRAALPPVEATDPAASAAPVRSEAVAEVVTFDVYADGVVVLTLRDTRSKNAFSVELAQALAACFERIRRTPEYKVVVLTGYGAYFACGGTKEALLGIQAGQAKFTDRVVSSLPLECELPVIAAMQGHAIGAGWTLGLFCDHALFSAESLYHSPYLRYGFTPGAGATLVVPDGLGDDLGREVLFTAREYSGAELAARGLTAPVLPRADVLPRALALAHRLAQSSREALVAQKAAAARRLRARLADAYARELAMHEQTFVGNAEVRDRIAREFGPAAEAAMAGERLAADGRRATAAKPSGLRLSPPAVARFIAPPMARPQARPLVRPAAAVSGRPTGGPIIKANDVLDDLKSALGGAGDLVPTLNRTGVMLQKLTPTSAAFARYAGQCGGEVLDAGCAYGVATIAALEEGATVLALDMEPRHLEILDQRIRDSARPRLRTHRAELPNIDFAAGRFSAIHAARVIHFLRPDAVRLTLRKMFEWLRPGGRLFLVSDTPYVGYWSGKAGDYEARRARGEPWPGYIDDVGREFGRGVTDGAPPLINALDPDILRRECEAAGFEVEQAGFEGTGVDLGAVAAPATGREHAAVIARKPAPHPPPERAAQPAARDDASAIRDDLKRTLAEALHTKPAAIDEDSPFIELGVDSVISVTWVRGINTRYGLSIGATRIYDHPSVRQFAEFLRDELARPAGAPAVALHPAGGHEPPRPYGLVLSKAHRFAELALTRWTPAAPAPAEVRIAVKASAISFTDTLCVRGLYPASYPFVPGLEVAGIVTAVGAGVTGLRVGDAVIAITRGDMGGHAEFVNVPAAHAVAKPAALSFEDACALPLAFGMSYHALVRLGRIAAGERVLVHTAAGGCGLMALQLAWLHGCLCHGTSRRAEKRELLRRLGVSHVLDYTAAGFEAELRGATAGRGVDVVLNTLSGPAIQQGLNGLAPSGRYLELATHALLTSPRLDLSKLRFNQSIQAIAFLELLSRPGGAEIREFLERMAAWAAAGTIVPTVSRVYPLRQIAEALEYVSTGQHVGKVVISHTAELMEDRLEACLERVAAQKRRAESVAVEPRARAVVTPVRTGPAPVARETERIAVIGMAGRFPKSPTLAAYWDNIVAGRSCISEIPPSRWPVEQFYDPDPTRPGKTCSKWMGVLEDVDRFDPLLFQISPAEARLMDPQQRLFLEACWSCVEDAAINPRSLGGANCGVFAGCGLGDYGLAAERAGVIGTTGVAPSILPARVSYLLNLKGPSLAIDTACSASLVALAQACDSLLLGNCDLALAGGVLVMTGPSLHVGMSQGGMLSPDGRCFTFDERANGFVPGEGVGVVLLKRLSDAVRDGDPIQGVIRGWGINQDGKTNGITAPSMTSQLALERGVYDRFGINPETIALAEAHGTGTKLGDPIEVEALTAAFRGYTARPAFCALGSVKSNIGHLGVAAGIAGLLKVLLALRHRTLPPTINFARLNPHIPLAGSPFYISQAARAWEAEQPRRATVSSFGFSGTNAHLVVEEPPAAAAAAFTSAGPAIVVLSARTDEALRQAAGNLAAFVAAAPDCTLHEIAYTLQVGREPMAERLALVATSLDTLRETLAAFAAGRPAPGLHRDQAKRAKPATAATDASLEDEIRRGDYEAIAAGWTTGRPVDWSRLYPAGAPRRLKLPTYPFARERYWLEAAPTPPQPAGPAAAEGATPVLLARPAWRERDLPAGAAAPGGGHHVVFLSGFEPSAIGQIRAQIPGAECVPLAPPGADAAEGFAADARRVFETLRRFVADHTVRRALVQVAVRGTGDGTLAVALAALLKTARLENPKLVAQLLEIEGAADPAEALRRAAEAPDAAHLRWNGGRWFAPALEEFAVATESAALPWKDHGVYLITGGAGGLGLIFAEEIARTVRGPALILAGRSAAGQPPALDRLAALGARVAYRQVDVADAAAVEQLVTQIRADYGALDGVLHAAGVRRDNFILKKSPAEFAAVLAPKVAGVVNLDAATRDLPLDLFVLFSSAAAATGNAGQADYAAANAFLDAFAAHRAREVQDGRRPGRTLSVNWPLWQDGGMRPGQAAQDALRESTGMAAMDTAAGLRAFYAAVATGLPQVVVLSGEIERIRADLRRAGDGGIGRSRPTSDGDAEIERRAGGAENRTAVPTPGAEPAPGELREQALRRLKPLLGEIIELPPERIDADEPLERYGMDSLMVTRLNQQLRRAYPLLSQTVFFEFQTLGEVAAHLAETFPGETIAWTRGDAPVAPASPVPAPAVAAAPSPASATPAATPVQIIPANPGAAVEEPIAIIGLSGRYAQADTLEAFWANLAAGRDAVTEIPPERWSLDGFYHANPDEAVKLGRSYSKWGSFLDGFAEFDPLFFAISPLEALGMDPQERLFLQSSWEVLESAGYTRARLAETIDGDVGVFVGITKTGFNQYRAEWHRQGEVVAPYTSFGSVANRVSYVLNLKGPSMPIDTMCSSSLTAIHEACEHLRRGSCRMAIAGGVNLYLHPSSYVGLCAQRMLSPDGRCRSFGAGANGFVPGEGVGALLLKPLAQALADGDPIHALIRGTSVNHGGKTNGYTVPNPNAQRELVRRALEKSGIDARRVSYIEAHGTGTDLGDPIEVTGLAQAFARDTADTGFCALGSVKSNLGHLEAAAGIAGVTKVVLQLRHRMLAPSLHARALNPKIDFARTPFVVPQAAAAWARPVVMHDGRPTECPRIAGVSSFGAGGANAHVIIEEPPAIPPRPAARRGPAVIVLSAKTDDGVRAYARRLAGFLAERAEPNPAVDLHDLAYTLQVGREPMDERAAFIAASVSELREQLAAFAGGSADAVGGCHRGRVPRDAAARLYADEDMGPTIAAWCRKGKLAQIAELWVRGGAVPWEQLYGEPAPRRIVAPTYPFARERYWVEVRPQPAAARAALHPMVHANASDLAGLRFSSVFGGDEFFLADHVVNGAKVLPGVACLEMARFAARQVAGGAPADPVIIRNVVWARPIAAADGETTVQVRLTPAADHAVSFTIEAADRAGGAAVCCQGLVMTPVSVERPAVDLDRVRSETAERRLDGGACQAVFSRMGVRYGPRFQAIEELRAGQGQALARLVLPAAVATTLPDFLLHPSLVDGALQACLGLATPDAGEPGTFVPYAVDEVTAFAPCPARAWAWVRPAPDAATAKLDIDVCDDDGRACVALRGLAFRRLESAATREAAVPALLFAPEWRLAPVAAGREPVAYDAWVVAACGVASPEPLDGARCERLRTGDGGPDERFAEAAAEAFALVRSLLRDPAPQRRLLQVVIPADGDGTLFAGLAGLLKTARLENPAFVGQVIAVDPAEPADELARKLAADARCPEQGEIRHDRAGRHTPAWRELAIGPAAAPWKDGGVYLITGGAGGLGTLIGAAIARQSRGATVVLCGRSAADEARQRSLRAIEAAGAKVVYRQADVTRSADVIRLVAEIQEEHGALDGVIHAAGLTRDHLIRNKSPEEFRSVLAPKVAGAVRLDLATRDVALDFFVVFAAGAGVWGNPGQADYATANAFLDEFARQRNQRVAAGARRGRTLSVDWPLWAAGGMRMPEPAVAAMRATLGLAPLPTEAGLAALARALASGRDQVLVASGDAERIRAGLAGSAATVNAPEVLPPAVPGGGDAALEADAIGYFRDLLVATLRVPANRIPPDAVMSDLGIDSVVVMNLTNRLEQTFGPLSKTLFFEHPTVRALARHFLAAHPAALQTLLRPTAPVVAPQAPAAAPATAAPAAALPMRSAPAAAVSAPARAAGPLDVAIIGVSGRYPQAANLDAFWAVLRDGRDCITEIPPDRWDWRDYYSDDPAQPKGHSSKWGGFLDDVDKFDPQFFAISPKVAPYLDPQERLILEEAWKALEDAGYRRDDLAERADGEACAPVGVYIGAMYGEYQLLGAEASRAGRRMGFAGNLASLANRLSYVLNLHGPSMMVDTMCSSSLTCLHLACEDLVAGRTNYAIAGGVNVTVHPNKYLMLSGGQFLSAGGRCESFGEGGAGYIPSEGVGVVVLKRLADAERDGDHIHAVIKATAVNHGGRTHGYSVPNPKAQERVIAQALAQARLDPRAVSYIEAHGTGTKLGDPIEMAGLANAFQARPRGERCWIGSVKSNIGHCESAAGIAGLTKVLLQLKHGLLAPSLHARVLNPHIDFAATPFAVNQALREWQRPVIDGREQPRIAGISSFGAGGSNAHVIVEEYRPAPAAAAPADAGPALVVLSARTAERLAALAGNLRTFLDGADARPGWLHDLAYTLQVGREPMDERLGFVVRSVGELKTKLDQFLRQEGAEVVRGRVDDTPDHDPRPRDPGLGSSLDTAAATALLQHWVRGGAIDWRRLYGRNRPQRISLPTYPFVRKRYWVDVPSAPAAAEPGTPSTPAAAVNGAEAGPGSRVRPLAVVAAGARSWTPAPVAKPAGIALAPTARLGAVAAPGPAAVSGALTPPAVTAPAQPAAPTPPVSRAARSASLAALEAELLGSLAQALFLEPDEVSLDKPFLEMGLDSIVGVEWVNALNRKHGLTIPANRVYEHPNLRAFAAFVARQLEPAALPAGAPVPPPVGEPAVATAADAAPAPAVRVAPVVQAAVAAPAIAAPPAAPESRPTDIAIVGFSGQFPGGPTGDAFWQLLREGRTAFTELPADRGWDLDGPALRQSGVARGAFLRDIDRFDPLFFHLSPKEAATMDPGERLFLQEAWRALEDAGVVPAAISGRRWGVYCGNGGDYSLRLLETLGFSPHVTLAQVPSRVSHVLNLTGPSQSIDAGCASALLALAEACDQLVLGKCEAALAGGVFVHSTPNLIVSAAQVELLAKNGGGGRALDQAAAGMVPGEAVGVVVLKRLADAVAAGDRIHGVIEGWGNNHNGRTNGMVAPNVDAQEALFTEVYGRFAIDPDAITLVEASAAGLPLADTAEVQALTRAFRRKTARRQFCALGSIENNIGHAFHAAGMGHVARVLLSLRHGEIPAMPNVANPTPALGERGPFFVNANTIPWSVPPGQRRRAAISSFGATGANVHLVIAEPPPPEPVPPAPAPAGGAVLIAVSAKTAGGLRQRCRDLHAHLGAAVVDLRQLAANLLLRRSHFDHRAAIVATDAESLRRALLEVAEGRDAPDAFVGSIAAGPALRPSLEALAKAQVATLAARAAWLPEDLRVLADLHFQGVPLGMADCFSAAEKRPVSLPGYPFEQRRCWIGAPARQASTAGVASPDSAGSGAAAGFGDPALHVIETGQADGTGDRATGGGDALEFVTTVLAELTGLTTGEIDSGSPLSAYGVDSLVSLRLLNRLRARLDGDVDPSLLVGETVGGLAAKIAARGGVPPRARPLPAPAATAGWAQPPFIARIEIAVTAHDADAAAGEAQLARLIAAGIGVWREPGRLRCEFLDGTHTRDTVARLLDRPGALHHVLADGRRYFPASDMQRFALDESETNQRTTFNLCQGFRIDGPLDRLALDAALDQLGRGHSILRTGVRRVGGQWVQVVHDVLPLACREVVLSGADAPERFEAELRRFQRERADERFDPGRAPLFEVCAVHDGQARAAVFFRTHHLHADGFTLYFFQQELHRLYVAHQQGTPAPLPAPAAEYAQFALSRFTPARAADTEHWLARVRGYPRPAPLRERPGHLAAAAGTGVVELEIAPSRLAELQQFNRATQTTLTQLLTCAVAALLYRLTGAPHPIQMVFNRRDRAEFEGAFGDFSSSVPWLLRVDAGSTWRDLLQQYADLALELQRHRDFDFTRLLPPDAATGRPGMLGDVALDSNDRDTFGGVTAFAGRLIPIEMEDRTPVAPLLVCLVKTHGRLTLPFLFDRARFAPETVRLLAENVLGLIDEAVRAADARIADAGVAAELTRRLAPAAEAGS